MRCPNCHDTHVRQFCKGWRHMAECLDCGYTWDEDDTTYDILDYLDDLQCRYDILVGR